MADVFAIAAYVILGLYAVAYFIGALTLVNRRVVAPRIRPSHRRPADAGDAPAGPADMVGADDADAGADGDADAEALADAPPQNHRHDPGDWRHGR